MQLQCQNDHVLKHFTYHKISFFPFAGLGQSHSKVEKLIVLFSEILTCMTVGLIEKGLLFPGKGCLLTGICLKLGG